MLHVTFGLGVNWKPDSKGEGGGGLRGGELSKIEAQDKKHHVHRIVPLMK